MCILIILLDICAESDIYRIRAHWIIVWTWYRRPPQLPLIPVSTMLFCIKDKSSLDQSLDLIPPSPTTSKTSQTRRTRWRSTGRSTITENPCLGLLVTFRFAYSGKPKTLTSSLIKTDRIWELPRLWSIYFDRKSLIDQSLRGDPDLNQKKRIWIRTKLIQTQLTIFIPGACYSFSASLTRHVFESSIILPFLHIRECGAVGNNDSADQFLTVALCLVLRIR